MEKDIINRIIEKEFIELSEAERTELFEYCSSEEEYIQLKSMFMQIENMDFENPTPREETKRDLDQLFDQSYPRANPVWYNSLLTIIIPRDKPIYRQPILQVAALVLILFLVVPMFNTNIVESDVQMAKVEQPSPEKKTAVKKESASEKNDVVVSAETKAGELAEDIPEESEPTSGMTTTISTRGGMPDSAGELRSAMANSLDVTVSDHPDGVFMGAADDAIAFSQPASKTSDLMDLLTAAF